MIHYALGEIAGHRLADKVLEEYDWSENELAKAQVFDAVQIDMWTKGLGFVGYTGVGKTHLLIALYKERMWRAIYIDEAPKPIWLSFSDIMDLWVGEKDKEGVLEVLSRGDIIFIDDLFCKGYGDVELGIVREIVFKCYDNNKVICFTSNILLENMGLDARVSDRLKEMVNVTEITGESRR